MSKTIEQMLNEGGPVSITLWIMEGKAQANVREPDSTGWNCFTAPTATEALHKALLNRPMFRPAFLTPKATGTQCSVCKGPQFETPSGISCHEGHGGAESLALAVTHTPTGPIVRRVIRRPEPAPAVTTPTPRRIIRR